MNDKHPDRLGEEAADLAEGLYHCCVIAAAQSGLPPQSSSDCDLVNGAVLIASRRDHGGGEDLLRDLVMVTLFSKGLEERVE